MKMFMSGLLAGFLATAPMTVFMMLLYRRLPRREKYPLPPREITMELAGKAGGKMDENERTGLTLAAHFSYGTVMGSLYSLAAARLPGPFMVKGIVFGLLVWAGSYLVVLPALGVLSSAKEHPLRRNALMISAHAVWGAVLGLIVEWLSREGST